MPSESPPEITVSKTASQLQVFAPGENVTFTVNITNDSGAADPINITSLIDDIHGNLVDSSNPNLLDTSCELTVIQPFESYDCSFTVLVDGDETDVVTADGTDNEGIPVSDSANATVDMINPSISIETSTNGFDADAAPGPEILVGATVNWEYVVTNNGDVPLENVSVTDDQAVTVTCPETMLAVGESITCTANGTSVVGPYANLGTVNATHTDLDGDTADRSDSDPSHYFGAAPSVNITKTFADDSVIAGGAGSSFTLVVTNDGNVALSDVAVFDDVDVRLTVTGVSGTAGADIDSDSNVQTVEWLISSLAVGQSVTITLNFAVGSNVTEASASNTGTVNNTYTDDSGNTIDIDDEDSDTIDILVDINLSIVKTFDPASVQQGTPQTFTLNVTNDGPSDAVDVSVSDTVDSILEVTNVSVTSGTGDCSAPAGQQVDCTVQIPAGQTVTVTVEYLTAPFLSGDNYGKTGVGDDFYIRFVNGNVLEGTTKDGGLVLYNGADSTSDFSIVEGLTRNDIIFDPPGPDPSFEIHLSCSEAFEDDGYATGSGGPDRNDDPDWPIAFFAIQRTLNANNERTCGNVVNDFDVPNTGTASGTDSSGPQTVTSNDTVTITSGITLDRLQTNGKRVTAWLTNNGESQEITEIELVTWPDTNQNLKNVQLTYGQTSKIIWSGNEGLPDGGLILGAAGPATWTSGVSIPIDPNESTLRFDFEKKVATNGYEIKVKFDDGTFLGIQVSEGSDGGNGRLKLKK